MEQEQLRQVHRKRQGAILMLLLLGPSPIAVLLFVLGEGAAALAVVLASTAMLIGLMLELYRRQRRDAKACGLPVLAPSQVLIMFVILGGISAGTFLLPNPNMAPFGLAAVTGVIVVIYLMGAWIRSALTDPDERSVVLVLGLMAALIALANACQ